ncbi:MAG: formylglycine-generating enzyme family protein [Candidatus Krumholzibacteriota bacterium]
MILIPPGTFLMGSPESEPGRADHELQHKVTLTRAFWLGKTEVTQRQWKAVMGNNPAKIKGEDHPVEKVSWYDCVNFCNKLSALEGLTPAYQILGESVTWDQSADGYRLPTEAEWEYACRAGTTGPFAGDLDEMAIYSKNSVRKTRAVGTRKANPWGFHDMHGNVAEWCWDRYERDYGADWVIDPTGPAEGDFRIERGGNWHFNAMGCRSASRGTDKSVTRRNRVGFRLARWALN